MNQRFLRLFLPAVCVVGMVISGVFLIPDGTEDLIWESELQLLEQEGTLFQSDFSQERWSDSILDPQAFFQPSGQDKPWLVWYWPGTEVRLPQALEELTWIAEQGFGGVEIQITGKGISPFNRKAQFRDPRWLFLLEQVSYSAQQHGLEVDWVFGPGIPASVSRGHHGLTWGELHIRGNQEVSCLLPPPNVPLGHRLASVLTRDAIQDNSLSRWQPHSSELLGVWAGKPIVDERSAAFWNTADFIALDPDSTWSLMDWVRGDSLVDWSAPTGSWKIIAVYETDLSTTPYYSVASFEETVIDPYSAEDLQLGMSNHPAYLAIPRGTYTSRAIRTELQMPAADRLLPASGRQFFETDGLPHSLFPLLLAKPLADHAGADRIDLHRQREYKVSEMDELFEQYYEDWMVSQQLPQAVAALSQTINRSGYASKLVLNDWNKGWFDMAREVDIPGFDSHIADGNRLAASLICDGAHYGGKAHVTSYVGEVPEMAYSNTPQLLKVQIDRSIFTGATEIAVHGKPYRYVTDGEAWDPATTHGLHEVNHGGQYTQEDPFHRWWPTLWEYTSRLQYLSKLGTPQTDVLIVYPFSEFPTEKVDSAFSLIASPVSDELHWNRLSILSQTLLDRQHDSLSTWIQRVTPFIQELEEHGYTWSWMSERSLYNMTTEDASLATRFPGLQALLIPEGGSMRLRTAEAITALHQRDDLEIFLLGTDRPSIRELHKPDSSALVLAQRLQLFELPFPITSGSQLIQWLRATDLVPGYIFTNPSRYVRQRRQLLADGSMLLWLLNLSEHSNSVSIACGDQGGWILDPESGSASKFTPDQTGISTFSLSQYENKIIWLGQEAAWPDSLQRDISPARIPRLAQVEEANFATLDKWEWAIDDPIASPEIRLLPDTGLWDWRADESLLFYQGEISYTIDLPLTEEELQSLLIMDLGEVFDAVELQVNTHSLPLVAWAPYRFLINDYLHPGLNTIQIWVTNSARNRKIGDKIEGKANMNWCSGEEEALGPAGLLGPVQLWRIPDPAGREKPGM